MKEYVCSVCGYVHKGEIPDDFVCPVCGAGRDAFVLREERSPEMRTEKSDAAKPRTDIPHTEKPEAEKELSAMEMSVICSNLARGCEKQYLFEQAESFRRLAEFFGRRATPVTGDTDTLSELIGKDLSDGYPYAHGKAEEAADRGAKRALVWSEKVTRMLQSLLARYKAEGDKMLENTGVYVCSICGFVYVGNEPPALCPVCKVPAWKFEKAERRAE